MAYAVPVMISQTNGGVSFRFVGVGLAFFVLRASTPPQTGDMHDSDDINPHVDWDDDDDVQEGQSPP